jgi:hypothetical protein
MCVCGRSTRARCAECAPGRRLRAYELAVRDVLESCDATSGFAWNKRIHGTRLRPDFAWVFASACVVLEVDERAHASYPPDEERARERRIAQTLGRRVFFFRLRIAPNAPVESVRSATEAMLDTISCRIADAQEPPAASRRRGAA